MSQQVQIAACECVICCDGEHAGSCMECAGWGEAGGVYCDHCDGTGICPVCDGENEPAKGESRG